MKINNKLMLLTLLAISMSGQFLMSSSGQIIRSLVEAEFEEFKNLAESNRLLVNYLATGIDPNSIVYLRNSMRPTLLMQAAKNGNITVIKTLINHGVDINEKSESVMSPVGIAIWAGNIDVVQLLVDAGANLTQSEYRADSCFHLADDLMNNSSSEDGRNLYQKIKDILIAGPAPRAIATSVR